MNFLTGEALSEVVQRLPSLPHIVMELIDALDNGDVEINTLAQKISHDQALTAKVLGLANSSFYGMQSKVGSISHAISVLGFNSVRSLVTATAVVEVFSEGLPEELNYTEFWKHSIATALAAKALAKHCRTNEDQAFIGGLLHNIGRLVLATHSPSAYQAVLKWRSQHDEDLTVAEMNIFGIDHKSVGREALAHWKFPASIVETLPPLTADTFQVPSLMASVATVADAIAYGLDLSGAEQDRVPVILQQEWDALNLEQQALIDIFSTTERQFKEACMIFGNQAGA
jgi:putative nucleotidyltransferase with HDIG domain